MPPAATPSPQLDLFLRDTPAYQQALARYERLRPILQGQCTLTQQSHTTGISYHQLWQDWRRFQRVGLVGLLDHRVAYPLAAANVSRPLVNRLKSLHQPVVRARLRLSVLRSHLLACS
jgi:hypothetical protein